MRLDLATPHPWPNPYEAPGCQETDSPGERIMPIFFRCALGQALSVPGNVFRLHCRLLVRPRGCTKHVLSFSRRCHDEWSDRSE